MKKIDVSKPIVMEGMDYRYIAQASNGVIFGEFYLGSNWYPTMNDGYGVAISGGQINAAIRNAPEEVVKYMWANDDGHVCNGNIPSVYKTGTVLSGGVKRILNIKVTFDKDGEDMVNPRVEVLK